MSILELFCDVDDFCQEFAPPQAWPQLGQGKRGPQPSLSLSEVMTIIIHFHQSHYRTFKAYYLNHVLKHLQAEFPGLVSYSRFVELMALAVLPLCVYLHHRLAGCTGISFIDATAI